jgi:hypothetical protein
MLFISVLVVYRIVWLGGATRFGNSWHCEMTKQGRRRVLLLRLGHQANWVRVVDIEK